MNNKGMSLIITTIAIMVVLLLLVAFLIPAVFNRVRFFSGYLGSIEDKSNKYCFQVAEELNQKYEESENKEEKYIRYQPLNVIKDEECAAKAKEKAKLTDDNDKIREDDYFVFTSRDLEEDGSLCCLYRADEGKATTTS